MTSILPRMLDVRKLAIALAIEPIELVRQLLSDQVPVMSLSPRRWRVADRDFNAWLQRRQEQARKEDEQRKLRLGHVAGKAAAKASKRRAKFSR